MLVNDGIDFFNDGKKKLFTFTGGNFFFLL